MTLDFNIPSIVGIGHIVSLQDYYLGGTLGSDPGTNYGIHGIPNNPTQGQYYNDLWVNGTAIGAPIHNNGTLISDGGFQGSVAYDYGNGYSTDLEFPRPVIKDASGNLISYQIFLSDGSNNVSGRFTLLFSGIANYLSFGPDGLDMEGRSFDNMTFSDLIGYNQDGPITAAPEAETWVFTSLALAGMVGYGCRRKTFLKSKEFDLG